MVRAARFSWPFAAGFVAGGVAMATAFVARCQRRRTLHPRIVRSLPRHAEPPMVVFVPGICGSQLLRPDGTEAWLNLGNTFGHHDLRLPDRLPFRESRDQLHPGLLIGTDAVLPRVFGFTEYADVLELLDNAGYQPGVGPGARYAVFTYDWRRDLVDSAQRLALRLEGLARATGNPQARFHVIGHSMGGLLTRYYLRFGGAEPRDEAPVTWAGARRIASLIQVATPNAGSVASLGAVLHGERVGLSHTTLAASVIQRMPSIYQLLPPAGTHVLLDEKGRAVTDDVQDPATWRTFGWGPFGPAGSGSSVEDKGFVEACLRRAQAFHAALARPAGTPCPVPMYMVGGDCLLTAARAVVRDGRDGALPRFEARTAEEQDLLFEAGDGRVTRASLLGSHLPAASAAHFESGYGETSGVFLGSSDHHGHYADPAFQSLLLRLLLRPARAA